MPIAVKYRILEVSATDVTRVTGIGRYFDYASNNRLNSLALVREDSSVGLGMRGTSEEQGKLDG